MSVSSSIHQITTVRASASAPGEITNEGVFCLRFYCAGNKTEREDWNADFDVTAFAHTAETGDRFSRLADAINEIFGVETEIGQPPIEPVADADNLMPF
jgi:hypothetical protein